MEYGTQVWTPDLKNNNKEKEYYLGGQLESILEINAGEKKALQKHYGFRTVLL